MATKKRQYKCGTCKELGHNARKCPTKAASAVAAPAKAEALPVVETVVEAATPAPEIPTAPPEPETNVSAQVAIDGNADLVGGHRKANTRPAAPAAPYDCPTCGRVGILVLCKLEDGSNALRCEHCMNKSPLKSIMKWGARPEDLPNGQRGVKPAEGRLFGQ